MTPRSARRLLLLALLAFVLLSPPSRAQAPGTAPRDGFAVMADGAKIHYLEAGQGRAILFVPGWTMAAGIWDEQIRHFARSYRVVAVDPRSQGKSSKTGDGAYPAAHARDLKELVDQLHLAPVVLVGWSNGVPECAAYVAQFGTADLAGLVFVDGVAGAPFPREQVADVLDFFAGFGRDRKASTERFVRSMYRTPRTEEYIRSVVADSLETPSDTAVALIVGAMAEDERPALGKIDRPTLIVGAKSPRVGVYEEMKAVIPGARLEVFDGAGHALFVDRADRFDALLDGFLQGLAAAK
jgi:non-heme chloroperoxidase